MYLITIAQAHHAASGSSWVFGQLPLAGEQSTGTRDFCLYEDSARPV